MLIAISVELSFGSKTKIKRQNRAITERVCVSICCPGITHVLGA